MYVNCSEKKWGFVLKRLGYEADGYGAGYKFRFIKPC